MARERITLIKQDLAKAFDGALQSLQVIWDEIGIDERQRDERVNAVADHLGGMLEEMVKEEQILKNRLIADVDKHGKDVIRLSKELGMPPVEPKEGLTILELEKELRLTVDQLAKERHRRMKVLKKLRETDQTLCDLLCCTPYYIPTGAVPTQEKLNELEQHIKALEEEKIQRQSQYRQSKKEIIQLMEDLDRCPNSSFEREIIGNNDESFVLSQNNMKRLKTLHSELETKQKENFTTASRLRERMVQLWDRLQVPEPERASFNTENTGFRPKVIQALQGEIARCELLKRENLENVIGKVKEELFSWWDKCYYSPEQRRKFTYNEDENTDEILDLLDAEVERVKRYYEENKEMLGKVSRWQILFAEFLEHERKAADPSRFFNRGCNLLKEEKARKKVTKELPKVEEEVKREIEKWEADNQQEFLIGGKRFVDFIKVQWEEYNLQKEDEKKQRQQAKARQLEEESKFGAITPGKRRMNGTTPGRTPSKLRRADKGERIPCSTKLNLPPPTCATAVMTGSIMSSCSSAGSSIYTQPAHILHEQAILMNYYDDLGETLTPRTPGASMRLGTTRTGTPGSSLRVANTRNATGIFASPALSKSKMMSKTPKSKLPGAAPNKPPRKALGERNDTAIAHPGLVIDHSIASVGHYTDFAHGLSGQDRENHRSSMLPKPMAFF